MSPTDEVQLDRFQREEARWLTLRALHMACPGPLSDNNILRGLVAAALPASLTSVRRDLDYLASKSLIELVTKKQSMWVAKLTAYGTDVVEYAKDAPAGIARPDEV